MSADYPEFLEWLYSQNLDLSGATYAKQRTARNESLFSTSDFYSTNFWAFDHPATEVQFNNRPLQMAWAREHGMKVSYSEIENTNSRNTEVVAYLKRKLRRHRRLLAPIAQVIGLIPELHSELRDVLLAQIEEFQPDVIINQDIAHTDLSLLRRVKKKDMILVAQCNVDPPIGIDLSCYDFGISLIPWVVELFRSQGLKSVLHHLAFEPSVLEKLGPPPQKDVQVSFVGGLSSDHRQRISLLEAIAERHPLDLWLSNFRGLPANSSLRRHYRGSVWGKEMYHVLRRSKITLNSHIDASRGTAGNMRLYEATGVGTFLLTDDLPNLPTLFEPGRQVGTYSSVQDCLDKLTFYLENANLREDIAREGQQKTLTHHTYNRRVAELLHLFEAA